VSGLIKYPEQRAVEDAAFGQDVAPTRLCRVLLPVWRADVRATIYDSEPYDLIDEYLAKAIAQGQMGSVEEIAGFYGVDAAVIANAARFLESIGHLSCADGGLRLSSLGLRSVQEERRYTQKLADRRHLYFDGFTCRPLARPFYDDRVVTFLEGTQLAEAITDTGRDAFTPVIRIPQVEFSLDALTELERMPAADRDHLNLPEQVIEPVLEAAEQVYLPAYVVRAIGQHGEVRYLTYTQASQKADPDWSQVCTMATDIAMLVENEYQSGQDEGEESGARRWVQKRFPGRFEVGWHEGVLVANLPAAAFRGTDSMEPHRIGSFIRMNGWYFRLWCDDEALRRRALLDLTETYLSSRTKTTADEAGDRLARFCCQVALGPMSIAEIASLARKSGKKALASQLENLTELSLITGWIVQQGAPDECAGDDCRRDRPDRNPPRHLRGASPATSPVGRRLSGRSVPPGAAPPRG
jgi:hypothetical protein